jgi:outer membrane protein assembly factor BamB
MIINTYSTRIASALVCLLITGTSLADDWLQFRGPGGSGAAVDQPLPIQFDTNKNIAWKADLPAKGASGPIVIGDNVVVTCSGGDDQDQLYVTCLDAGTGAAKWTQKFWATGRCFCHPLSANAAPTPTSDGKYIYAFYSSNDLACIDLDGKLIWYRGLAVDRPKAGNDVGMAASPVVHDGIVVVQIESQNDSFAIGLNAATGETVWTIDRDRDDGWSSPLLLTCDGAPPMVVLQSPKRFTVVELHTGKTVFEAAGKCGPISSAVAANGRLFVPMDGTTAFAVSAEGKFEKIWNSSQIQPSTASCVVYGGSLFAINRAGVLTGFNILDGQPTNKVRVGGTFWSTPIIAASHMYCFTQDGKARVVELGSEPKVVHEHDFGDEVFLGSPAVSGGALYIRSDKSIWKITETSDSSS